jgi:hypothetical protein
VGPVSSANQTLASGVPPPWLPSLLLIGILEIEISIHDGLPIHIHPVSPTLGVLQVVQDGVEQLVVAGARNGVNHRAVPVEEEGGRRLDLPLHHQLAELWCLIPGHFE